MEQHSTDSVSAGTGRMGVQAGRAGSAGRSGAVGAPGAVKSVGPMAAAAALGLAALYVVMQVYAAGQTLLAVTLLLLTALALWVYTSRRSEAARYLFPGIATALIFVVFPMLYTVGIGFTNYSSNNLLDLERTRAYLQEEAVQVPGSLRAFSLHAQPGQRGQFKLRLVATGEPTAAGGAERAWVTAPFDLHAKPLRQTLSLQALSVQEAAQLGPAEPLRSLVQKLPALRELRLQAQPPLEAAAAAQNAGTVNATSAAPITAPEFRLVSLREFAQLQPLYALQPDGSLLDRVTQTRYQPDPTEGFFTSAEGSRLTPGYQVGVGVRHYQKIFSEGRFREPFLSVFIWTVVFSAFTVLGSTALGLFLAVLLNWEALRGKAIYRLVLFLPYAVPGFISILIFKGLFNQNLGEINLILHGLFGIRPAWFSDPFLAKTMLLIVNVWLGFPYMMVLCSGLIKSIPADLYEASAVVGAGPWVNFRSITMPLILKPLTPLLISAFAFNFNNFVLISLLTEGRPDQIDATLPAGTTDILVSYTWRIAFQDTGQQFGLAAAISTVIFSIVAAITLVQMRFTRLNDAGAR